MGNASQRPPRRVTIRDVARLAGTSTSTVSVAVSGRGRISEPTRRRVLAAADRLGWRPDRRASALRQFEPRLVGLVYEAEQSFQAHLLDAMYVSMGQAGLEMVLAGATRHHDERRCVDELLREGCRALVVTGLGLSDQEMGSISAKVPTLSLCRQIDVAGVDAVACDSLEGGRLGVEMLVELGHRDIVHVDGSGVPMSARRAEGYAEAMTAHGLGPCVRILRGGSTVHAGALAARSVAAMPQPPTAVTCFNDMCAAGLVHELRLLGLRVPDDVSVIGYDDAPVAADPTVSLTTVRQDTSALARKAAAILRGRVRAGRPVAVGRERTEDVPVSLVIRNSTAAPRR